MLLVGEVDGITTLNAPVSGPTIVFGGNPLSRERLGSVGIDLDSGSSARSRQADDSAANCGRCLVIIRVESTRVTR